MDFRDPLWITALATGALALFALVEFVIKHRKEVSVVVAKFICWAVRITTMVWSRFGFIIVAVLCVAWVPLAVAVLWRYVYPYIDNPLTLPVIILASSSSSLGAVFLVIRIKRYSYLASSEREGSDLGVGDGSDRNRKTYDS